MQADAYLAWLTVHLSLLNKYQSLPRPPTTDIRSEARDELLALVNAKHVIREHLEAFFLLPPNAQATQAPRHHQVTH